MATADELLNRIDETDDTSNISEVLVIDLNTRIISIPATVQNLGVESDDDVNRLHFTLPRYYGEFDLSEFKFNVNFENARGTGDLYPVNDVRVADNNKVEFSWLVDRTAFMYSGNVNFSICMKKYDSNGVVEKELNTAVATLPVLEGLETSKEVVETNPSAFDEVMFRLYAVEAATGLGQNGYYNLIKVTENSDGVVFTIVNQDGETVTTVKHGIDGYSPVKGVDYYTEAEKTEFETAITTTVTNHVNRWSPTYRTVELTTEGWVDNLQTISFPEVDDNSVVFSSPEPSNDNFVMYADSEIRCVDQGDGTLTFQCASAPSSSVLVNVAVYFSRDIIQGSNDA